MNVSLSRRVTAVAVFTAFALMLGADPALAQDISTGLAAGHRLALAAVRVLGAIIVLASFGFFCFGKAHWSQGVGVCIGLVGMAKSEAIAAALLT